MRGGFKGRALALSSTPQGESNRVVLFYSEGRGRISAVAHGVRKPGSRFGGLLEPGVLISGVFRHGFRRSGLYTLAEASLERSFSHNVAHLKRIDGLLNFFAALQRTVGEAVPDADFFRAILSLLGFYTDGICTVALFQLLWKTLLLQYSGVLPDWSGCGHCSSLGPVMLLSGNGLLCRNCIGVEPVIARLHAGDVRLLELFSTRTFDAAGAVRMNAGQIERMDFALTALLVFQRSGT